MKAAEEVFVGMFLYKILDANAKYIIETNAGKQLS
jgi:hypothetical protein